MTKCGFLAAISIVMTAKKAVACGANMAPKIKGTAFSSPNTPLLRKNDG